MIWVFVLGAGLALTFSTLGALSVWVKLLAIGLKAALFVLGILSLAFIWKHLFRKSPESVIKE
jgi:hypothetical protein